MLDAGKNIIDTLRDRQPFRVPDGYFEDFTEDLMRRLPKKIASESKVISIYDRIKPWLYIAAIFVGIIFVIYFFNKTSEHSNVSVLSSIRTDLDENDDADFFEIFEEMYVDKYTLSYIIDDFLID